MKFQLDYCIIYTGCLSVYSVSKAIQNRSSYGTITMTSVFSCCDHSLYGRFDVASEDNQNNVVSEHLKDFYPSGWMIIYHHPKLMISNCSSSCHKTLEGQLGLVSAISCSSALL